VERRSSPAAGPERRGVGSVLDSLAGRSGPAASTGAVPRSGPAAVAAAQAQTRAPRAPGRATATLVEDLPPLPEEVVVHRRLKSAFIDFDALVATLRADRLTGYLRAQARDFEGVLLFARGERGLSSYRGEEVVIGPRAGELVRQRAAGDDVLLDVVRVRAVTAEMLPQLFAGRSQVVGVTRFLLLDELLAHLVEEGSDVAVKVTGLRDCGVAVVRGGRIDSAWTRLHPRPLASLDAVLAVARERDARVEMIAAAGL
jgi:hypothetical protein